MPLWINVISSISGEENVIAGGVGLYLGGTGVQGAVQAIDSIEAVVLVGSNDRCLGLLLLLHGVHGRVEGGGE